MKNLHLDTYTATDIDLQVSKILRDLGNPEPPLDLDKVRELLKLAKDYYSTTDDGVFKRWMHALKVAGKQIAERPAFLKDLVQSFRLDALCLFDEKRILISKELPEPKQRWAEGHEIGHRHATERDIRLSFPDSHYPMGSRLWAVERRVPCQLR